MSQMTNRERGGRFVGALRHLRDRHDRGALAALRGGLNPSTVTGSWPIIARLGGEIGQPGESVHVDVAALFATHPVEAPGRNLGAACRAIALDGGDEVSESNERRFRRLLAADSTPDLVQQLRTWVRLAASKGVGIDYVDLFVDLCNWPHYSDDIRVKWARSFWRAGGVASDNPEEKATQ